MTSRQRDDVTLTNILKQVDTLEREIRDLGREAQKGEQFVKNLEEVIDRLVKYVEWGRMNLTQNIILVYRHMSYDLIKCEGIC